MSEHDETDSGGFFLTDAIDWIREQAAEAGRTVVDVVEVGIPDLDLDGDGLTTQLERQLETDPWRADTDGDTVNDGDELVHGSHPHVVDTDGDGLRDDVEINWTGDAWLWPDDRDSDGDGIRDDVEYRNEVMAHEAVAGGFAGAEEALDELRDDTLDIGPTSYAAGAVGSGASDDADEPAPRPRRRRRRAEDDEIEAEHLDDEIDADDLLEPDWDGGDDDDRAEDGTGDTDLLEPDWDEWDDDEHWDVLEEDGFGGPEVDIDTGGPFIDLEPPTRPRPAGPDGLIGDDPFIDLEGIDTGGPIHIPPPPPPDFADDDHDHVGFDEDGELVEMIPDPVDALE